MVGYRSSLGKGVLLPQLTIKSYWLNELGFTTGPSVTITNKKAGKFLRLRSR
ncbi:hypothetical protein DKK70_09610 [Gilliamella apicola]|uniref:Toxin SymE-like domain-containing protein n=1 Tax=Gilliamella apicola TaxID=1196095 RepID=A0A2V4E4Z7_9GAMM|nr:hypothetical protein DKK70_09610 [Gilliamella apicola]